MVELNAANLAAGALGLAGARNDRGGVTPGIVHIGVGGFHRAHQAIAIELLLTRGEASEFGICGVGLLPADAAMRDALTAQDYLYTLTLMHPNGTRESAVVGAIVDYLFAPDDPARVVEAIAAPTTTIVTLTVTEGGYHTVMKTGEFDFSSPTIRADLEPGSRPTTWLGLLAAGTSPSRTAWWTTSRPPGGADRTLTSLCDIRRAMTPVSWQNRAMRQSDLCHGWPVLSRDHEQNWRVE